MTDFVDDSDAQAEAKAWAYGEVATGRSAEDVTADLIANGWSQEQAEEWAEVARRQTSHRRGAVRREDVSKAAENRYRTNVAHNPLTGGGGMFGVFGSFLRSLASLFSSRKPPRRGPP